MPKKIDMEFFNTNIGESVRHNLGVVLQTCKLSEGGVVKAFEQELSRKLGLCNPVAVNSGTSALHLGLILAGVKSGDEVILPAQTFVATGMTVLMCGATPVFADINPKTGNICPKSVKKKITERTKAVLPVHWAGLPCDMDVLDAYAACLMSGQIVEDAAHAFGATYNGVPIGGQRYQLRPGLTAFSFQATKHLTTGDGGCLCCTYSAQAEYAYKLRWFGVDRTLPTGPLGEREFDIEECGFKYHMNDVAAAIGIGNLEGFEHRLKRRQETGAHYRKELFGVPGVELTDLPSDRTHAYYCFPLLVDSRDRFAAAMKAKNIPVSIVASRIDKYSVFGGKRDDLPGTDYFDAHQINLPCHEALTDEDIGKVIEAMKGGW